MRKLFVVLLALAMLAACVPVESRLVRGSGDTVTVEVDATDFDELSVGYAFQVEITRGDEYRVLVTIDQNLEQYLEVGKQGRTLNIRMQDGQGYIDATMRAEVTMPELTRLELSGATRGSVSGFESAQDFTADVSGASTLAGDMTTGDAKMNISGASRVDLEGAGQDLDLEVSGASRADLGDFTVDNADVVASGASSALVNVSGRLNAEATGASSVRYRGDPDLGRIEASGGGSVQPE